MNTEESAVTTPALTIAQRMGHAAITTTTGMAVSHCSAMPANVPTGWKFVLRGPLFQ